MTSSDWLQLAAEASGSIGLALRRLRSQTRSMSPTIGYARPGCSVIACRLIETMTLLPGSSASILHAARFSPACTAGDALQPVFVGWWKRNAELTAVRDRFRAGDGEGPTIGTQRWFLHGILRPPNVSIGAVSRRSACVHKASIADIWGPCARDKGSEIGRSSPRQKSIRLPGLKAT